MMQRDLGVAAPYSSPNVVIVTPGTYSEDFYLQRDLLNLYVIGERNPARARTTT